MVMWLLSLDTRLSVGQLCCTGSDILPLCDWNGPHHPSTWWAQLPPQEALPTRGHHQVLRDPNSQTYSSSMLCDTNLFDFHVVWHQSDGKGNSYSCLLTLSTRSHIFQCTLAPVRWPSPLSCRNPACPWPQLSWTSSHACTITSFLTSCGWRNQHWSSSPRRLIQPIVFYH